MKTTSILRLSLLLVLVAVCGRGTAAESAPAVSFNYAFAPPHRITVALPDSSDKTLLDAMPGKLLMSWTYENLIYYSFNSFLTPPTKWKVSIEPRVDGHAFAQSKWERARGYLPVLRNIYRDGDSEMTLEITGASTAAIGKITLVNHSAGPQTMTLHCEVPGNWTGYNPAWVDHDAAADHLLAGWHAPADQVIILGIGADQYPVVGATVLTMQWNLKPGETRVGWLIRPYKSDEGDVAALRTKDWESELGSAENQWVDLLDRASRVLIPDSGVRNAFYACLADLFIMREPIAKGYLATIPGTEVYRSAPNPFESAIVAVALDQVGLHELSELGYRVDLDIQEANGDWTEPKYWSHLMWGTSGFKAWVVMEHYWLTGDTAFSAETLPPDAGEFALAGDTTRPQSHARRHGAAPAHLRLDAARHGRRRLDGRQRPIRSLLPSQHLGLVCRQARFGSGANSESPSRRAGVGRDLPAGQDRSAGVTGRWRDHRKRWDAVDFRCPGQGDGQPLGRAECLVSHGIAAALRQVD